MTRIQQGDVLLKKVSSIPAGERKDIESGILAAGEATGHHHRIDYKQVGTVTAPKATTPRLFTVNGTMYVEAPEPFTVVHEEHKPVQVPAGNWQVGIVREFDHFAEEARNVAD